jgi:hypothetical protein
MRPRINALTFRLRPGAAELKGLKALKSLAGLTALTALATLAVPAVASADTPAGPPAAPVTQTIANQASASSQRNGHTDWVLKYQFKQVSPAATLNVTNNATATATRCRRCAADGIAFQVVVTSAQNLATLNATNQASAVSSNCVRCSTFAGAYQIVYASNRKLAPWQVQSLNAVRFNLMVLRFTDLKGTALQNRLDKIADHVVAILNNGHSRVTPVTPALTPALAPALAGTPAPAALTTNNGPVINRSVKMTNPGS